MAIEAITTASWHNTPYAIEALDAFPRDMVLEALRERLADSHSNQKLALAYALAHFNEVDVEFLLASVASASGNECSNIIAALANSAEDALQRITGFADNANQPEDWRLKGRLAVIALHLGDSSIAVDIHRPDRPDPTQQTVFIHDVFPTWHGELRNFANHLRNEEDAGLRRGICLAIGKLSDLNDARQQWHDLLEMWYQQSPDSGTHSAAGWALRQWQVDLPKATEAPNWKRTQNGVTLIRVSPRAIESPGSNTANWFPLNLFVRNASKQTVTLSGFWLSDREISVELFQQFMDDEDYAEAKPRNWIPYDRARSPTARHPVQRVSWEDAVLFCNWLSSDEGLPPYYDVETLAKPNEYGTLNVEIRMDRTGYRLPSEAEWEYACRAGLTKDFYFGKDPAWLREYALFSAFNSDLPGSKMCNRLGLFDMHGNVHKWCFDWYSDYRARAYRGGGWGDPASQCRSAYRSVWRQTMRHNNLGFRVALSSSGKPSDQRQSAKP